VRTKDDSTPPIVLRGTLPVWVTHIPYWGNRHLGDNGPTNPGHNCGKITGATSKGKKKRQNSADQKDDKGQAAQ